MSWLPWYDGLLFLGVAFMLGARFGQWDSFRTCEKGHEFWRGHHYTKGFVDGIEHGRNLAADDAADADSESQE